MFAVCSASPSNQVTVEPRIGAAQQSLCMRAAFVMMLHALLAVATITAASSHVQGSACTRSGVESSVAPIWASSAGWPALEPSPDGKSGTQWSAGNHRLVIVVDSIPPDANSTVLAKVLWRRHDTDVTGKNTFIVDARSHLLVPHCTRLDADADGATFVFKASNGPSECTCMQHAVLYMSLLASPSHVQRHSQLSPFLTSM